MTDYKVATHAEKRSGSPVPEGKRHAYSAGAPTTACGFPLDAMLRFDGFQFTLQPPQSRCPICARVVAGDH